MRQLEALQEQQLDNNQMASNVRAPSISNNFTRFRSGTLQSMSINPFELEPSPRDNAGGSHRAMPSMSAKSNSIYQLDLGSALQRKMTNHDLFEFYKEHHRRTSLSSVTMKHSRSESGLIVEEHKVLDGDGHRHDFAQTASEWIAKVESLLHDQVDGVKQTLQQEIKQINHDLVNTAAFRKTLNQNDQIADVDANSSQQTQVVASSHSPPNKDIEQALQGVERLLDEKLMQFKVQITQKDAQSDDLTKILQNQLEEYKRKLQFANIDTVQPHSDTNNVNQLPLQQTEYLMQRMEQSDEKMQDLARDITHFFGEIHLLQQEKEKQYASQNAANTIQKDEKKIEPDNTNTNETLNQLAYVGKSLQEISQNLEQLQLENTKIRDDYNRVKLANTYNDSDLFYCCCSNRDLIEATKKLTLEKDQIAESKRSMVRKLNDEMEILRKEIVQIGKQQMESQLNEQAKNEKRNWFGGLFGTFISL
ncbi:hypothetical protein RFI_39907 [Reticulomyxa filosa]|uniref:Uncharacterized protein n=1 Tax=Reticulomyxa filosa TaxID=46433 RepID=X6L923_RETFI|nr:hypothetical protein RFI_39907 [Reticulomyxa filosa]|eukprot:ETN97621.1 hypothetical protein RFI_39907 [Reticulomyxa filosa]